jgi:sulfur-carrier protein
VVTVLFFASIREAIGQDREMVSLDGIANVDDLLSCLRQKGETYRDALSPSKRWRVAVNHEVADVKQALTSGDEVAIFPPVTGG